MIKGKPLSESRWVPSQHGWVDSGTMLLSDRSFIWVNKLRSGGMPTICRLQRGRQGERNCCAGCGVLESISHVLQHCVKTSDAKTARHNAPLRHLSGVLQRKSYEVEWEPHIRTARDLVQKVSGGPHWTRRSKQEGHRPLVSEGHWRKSQGVLNFHARDFHHVMGSSESTTAA